MIIRSSTTPGQINFHADEKYCTKSSKVQASGKKFMFEKKKKKSSFTVKLYGVHSCRNGTTAITAPLFLCLFMTERFSFSEF